MVRIAIRGGLGVIVPKPLEQNVHFWPMARCPKSRDREVDWLRFGWPAMRPEVNLVPYVDQLASSFEFRPVIRFQNQGFRLRLRDPLPSSSSTFPLLTTHEPPAAVAHSPKTQYAVAGIDPNTPPRKDRTAGDTNDTARRMLPANTLTRTGAPKLSHQFHLLPSSDIDPNSSDVVCNREVRTLATVRSSREAITMSSPPASGARGVLRLVRFPGFGVRRRRDLEVTPKGWTPDLRVYCAAQPSR